MRFGRIVIHPAGLIVLLLVGNWCYTSNSLLPLLYFIIFMALLIPTCYYVHRANERAQKRQMRDHTPS